MPVRGIASVVGAEDAVHLAHVAAVQGKPRRRLPAQAKAVVGLFVVAPGFRTDDAHAVENDALATDRGVHAAGVEGQPGLVDLRALGIGDGGKLALAVLRGVVVVDADGRHVVDLEERRHTADLRRLQGDARTQQRCLRPLVEAIVVDGLEAIAQVQRNRAVANRTGQRVTGRFFRRECRRQHRQHQCKGMARSGTGPPASGRCAAEASASSM